jgi:hypothetical protein
MATSRRPAEVAAIAASLRSAGAARQGLPKSTWLAGEGRNRPLTTSGVLAVRGGAAQGWRGRDGAQSCVPTAEAKQLGLVRVGCARDGGE